VLLTADETARRLRSLSGVDYTSPLIDRVDRIDYTPAADKGSRLVPLFTVIPSNTAYRLTTNEASRVESAGAVPSGTASTETGLTTLRVDVPNKRFAVHATAQRDTLADGPMLTAIVNELLDSDLQRAIEVEAISGDGTGEHFKGLLTSITLSQARSTDSRQAALVKAAGQVRGANESGNLVAVLNPTDMVSLLTDLSGAGGVPVFNGAIFDAAGITSFVQSTSLTAGTALVLDPGLCHLYARDGVVIESADSHGSDFLADNIRVLASTRLDFSLVRVSSACKVTGM
jgi:HK97 family phage major capsid protein